MPRRQFVADLQRAQNDIKPAGVLDIKAGDDDGQFEFEFAAPALDGAPQIPVTITAMIPDVSEYPKSHEYMIFCGDDAPPHVGQALQNVRNTERKTVFELIDMISTMLSSLAPDSDGDTPMQDSVYDEDLFEDEDGGDVYDDDDEAFSFGAPVVTPATAHVPTTSHSAPTSGAAGRAFRERLRSDLRAAKDAGFKVGHLGHLIDGYAAYVTVSVRIGKLGLSEEAMIAWQVEPSDYLILIIQYPNGYKTNEQLQAYDSIRLKPNIGMRVYAGKHYKPTLQEAIAAFTKARKDRNSTGGDGSAANPHDIETSSIRDTFVSKPLVSLLEDNLVPILRFRSTGMDWQGAEAWYNEVQGAAVTGDPNAVPDKYYEPEVVKKALPEIATSDQYRQRNTSQFSFPLLAMQFLLRHFVRCTEFCTVCHRQMDSELEAIKPYVCERPLCLFQYMAMGFGPSIEHEIMAQPYVVDLLISFCYSSAVSRKLKEFPDGLALVVPPINSNDSATQSYDPYGNPTPMKSTSDSWANSTQYEVGFDRERRELIFFQKPAGGCPVARGAWIVVRQTDNGTVEGQAEELHCRVAETTFYPTITIDPPVVIKALQQTTYDIQVQTTEPKPEKPATPAATPRWISATFTIYDQDFEQLSSNDKCAAICKLLDTLPNVKEMQDFLRNRHRADLKGWLERLSPASVSLLRWIIASNRACIMQVDGDGEGVAEGGFNKKQERLYGMKDHMQFRFAMGAPDKEQRFMSAVRNTTDRLSLQYPTIFAWHGSPLPNWHMIIREGLHFKNTDHGRAYGHGVYHAKDAHTSTGYSGMYGGRGVSRYGNWPGSVLRVNSALALNEIVNAPAEFVSNNPYYVVAQLDWIQTRYLFVSCNPVSESVKPGEDEKPLKEHPQDPTRTPTGTNSQHIVIPASAIKSGRPGKESTKPEKQSGKRHSRFFGPLSGKKQKGNAGDPIVIDGDDDDDAESVDTEPDDLTILFEEEPEPEPVDKELPMISKAASKRPAGPTTDFMPGTLDFATLPMMPMPTYAISGTTKRLMNELKNLAKLQEASNAADLGWYIDVEKIDNVYQWIVELHSFHTFEVKGKPLPLVADMKKRDIKSIVLEIRFGSDYPFSPPYIRVVRPRFLPFTQGGGGHIVIGGAMCMELLTNTGWNSVLPMDSVLMQVRLAIASEPFARLEGFGAGGSKADYGAGEAAEGYLRACASHGWKVPPGFQQVAHGMKPEGAV